MRKKRQSQKQFWGNDVQFMRQSSEKKGSSEAAKPPGKSTPVVSLKTLMYCNAVVDFTVAAKNFQKEK